MGGAVVFPGQGAQGRGMGEALYREFALAREVFAEASEAIHLDLARLCFEDPDHHLGLTAFTQPAVLTVSLTAWRVLEAETGLCPVAAAGHSVGEYSALAAAGVLPLAEAVRLVHLRGLLMETAVPNSRGGMAAVMGVSRELIAEVCASVSGSEIVVPANDNAPDQVVISGHTTALDRAAELLRQKGARVRRLAVSGPFHTELMAPVGQQLAQELAEVSFGEFSFPVLANVDAQPYPSKDAVIARLVEQLTRPVRWREIVLALDGAGVEYYIECGPGTVLAGLIKRTVPGARVFSFHEPRHLAEIERGFS